MKNEPGEGRRVMGLRHFAGVTTIIGTALAAGMADSQSVGDVMSKVSAPDFVQAFVGHCVLNPGRIDKVESAAKTLNYMPITGDLANMIGPQASDADAKMWLATEGLGTPYMLGISSGMVSQKEFAVCTLTNPYISTREVVNSLGNFDIIESQISDETEAGQRYRVWRARIKVESYITLTDTGPSITLTDTAGRGGATLAFMAVSVE